MATGITGDFNGLAKLVENFDELASGRFRSRLSARLADAARHEVTKSFDQERDPYGQKWQLLAAATIKARRGGGAGAKILQDTRRLRQSVTSDRAYTHDASGFEIGTNVEYAAIHNYGGVIPPQTRIRFATYQPRASNGRLMRHVTRASSRGTWANGIHIPRRQFLPDGQLGPIWTEAFKKEASVFITDLFKNAKGTR